MKKTFAALAALAALGLAMPAVAATKSKTHATADTCQSYAKQLDDAISTHANAPKLDAAKKAKSDGDAACAAKKYGDGVKQYKLGLKDLRVKPVRK
jgi:hypothetical protein